MKKLLLATPLLSLFLLGHTAPAKAACGVNSVPAVGYICDVSRNSTYSATSVGLVPASAATDIFCISAGSTRSVSVRKVTIAGTAGTAIDTPFLLYMRSALDTGGTAATGIALPVGVANGTVDPASTAVLTAYTANPTVASNPILMDAVVVDLPVTTAAGGDITAIRQYGSASDNFSKGIDIAKGSTNQLCVNLNGVSVSSGVLTIHMEWWEL